MAQVPSTFPSPLPTTLTPFLLLSLSSLLASFLLSIKQVNLRLPPPHQTSQHLPARVDIKLHLLRRGLIPSCVQILGRNRFESTAAQVESEAYEGVKLVLG